MKGDYLYNFIKIFLIYLFKNKDVKSMAKIEIDNTFSDVYRDTLRRESAYLRKVAMKYAYQYLSDGTTRMKFLNEIEQLIMKTELEVSHYCLSLSAGLDNISNEIERLEYQDKLLRAKGIMQYAVFESIRETENRNNRNKLALKQVGFISGALQVAGGYGVCVGSAGALCNTLGVGLIAQGSNNMVENGHYLLFREDFNGPLRNGYRSISKNLGYGDYEADVFYNVVDLSLSAGTLISPVLKDGSWKLFYYIEDDFIASWKAMGEIPIILEGFFDGMTIYSTYELNNGKNKNE